MTQSASFPRNKDPFGGPFNGQAGRIAIYLELMQRFSFAAVVETGTFTGSTTEFFASRSYIPVFSVEAKPKYADLAQQRLGFCGNVFLSRGDSRSFLRSLQYDPRCPKSSVFFYLDAHWADDIPLREEVDVIRKNWSCSVIMIDDFAVPGDEGYYFDDYGAGKALCTTFLDVSLPSHYPLYYPSLPSAEETGHKRGCVVLGTDSTSTKMLADVTTLVLCERRP